jgi:rare lipoprotein A (peptidoglycan hydrolase)
LPFGTMNKNNSALSLVCVDDCVPFTRGRVIDLALAGGGRLGMSNLAPIDFTVLSIPVKSTSRTTLEPT